MWSDSTPDPRSITDTELSKRVSTYSRWLLSSSARPAGPPPLTVRYPALASVGLKVFCSRAAAENTPIRLEPKAAT